MPLYTFKCGKCGGIKEIVKSMKDESVPECCGSKMGRDFISDLPIAGDREYRRPLHSDALAISPAQKAEHEKLFPNVPLDNELRPVFTSFKQHESYLKKTGFEKVPARKKRTATRIA